jgi:hypothetical protein
VTRRTGVLVLAAGSAVLAIGAVAVLVGVANLQVVLSEPTVYEPGADPGFLEYQRLLQLSQVLWASFPWLAFAGYLPAIGALVLAAWRPRKPPAREDPAT